MSRYAIDATPLLLRSAGIKNYLHHLISHLAAERGGDEILVYPFLDLPGALDHDRSVAGRAGTAWRILSLYLSRLGVPLIDWTYGERCDLFHASLHVNHPPKRPRLTATVYDMTCWLVPETHTRANVRATQEFGDAVMRRADGLIAISEATKRDAIRILGIDDQTIRVIYPGVIDAFFGAGPEEVERARQAYGLKKPYLLYVGALEPRKNIGRLLDAWELLPRDIREEYELVAAGQMGWHSEALRARLAEPGKGWRYLGYVPESLLPGLTAGAAVAVYPSLYEGFGFPVAQALAAGVPVITSNVSSMPEIAGEAGLLVDPLSIHEIQGAMATLVTSDSMRDSLRGRAKKQAARFRWTESARETLAFFREVVS